MTSLTSTDTQARTLAATLAGALTGRLLLPGDDGFDAASTPWNLAVRQPVAAVVEVAEADDVVATVRHARSAGLTVAAQSTGHGASGDVAGTVLLRTGRLDDVQVDHLRRTARVGAGAPWGAVQAAAAPHGLTTLLGSAPGVGAVGYTLGGGLGWFSRAHGLAADHVRSFDVVDAGGERRTVSATADPDLFWALRGGGGDLAVVTSMEIDLEPVPAFSGGRVAWPAARAGEVLDVYRRVTATAPPALSLWLSRVEAPGAPAVVVLHAAYLGEAGAARDLLAPFAAVPDVLGPGLDVAIGPVALADVGDVTADPADPAAGKGRTELLRGIDGEAVERLFTSSVAPLLMLQLRHLGGALAEPGDDAGALGAIAEPYLLYAFGLAFEPGLATAVGRRLEALPAELAGVGTLRKPATFLAPGESAAAAYDGETLARLRDLKRARDPRGTIRGAYPLLG
ncbi:FAD-binding oxidoreductase [Krasilnikoviella flava]|uniref:FAD/FMN-containing dehydrogenase n=1 Tax=Krasilnikoviella flava TaxID=526729 RepID=A0A1T5LY83_9MICO|nr:FAD-binding oxidoreductase [Krasilnikoviella flava]SKC80823.1 FAD/FMN-containing dehydrogenase [Krasilnikoviella flava]